MPITKIRVNEPAGALSDAFFSGAPRGLASSAFSAAAASARRLASSSALRSSFSVGACRGSTSRTRCESSLACFG
jgi:hypothetical protein